MKRHSLNAVHWVFHQKTVHVGASLRLNPNSHWKINSASAVAEFQSFYLAADCCEIDENYPVGEVDQAVLHSDRVNSCARSLHACHHLSQLL